jgi:hypothetical protein
VTIKHGLGRVPVGWMILDRTTAATIHRVSWDSISIVLAFSGACSTKVLVY